MAIEVKELKEQLKNVPDNWLIAAYEGEGVGLTAKAPDYDWGNHDESKVLWIETGVPS